MRYAIPDEFLIDVVETKCSLDFLVNIDTEPQWAEYSVPFLAEPNEAQRKFFDVLKADAEAFQARLKKQLENDIWGDTA